MRTDQEIVDEVNIIAGIIYKSMGYTVPSGTVFHGRRHPHEAACWNAACEIELLITDTDVIECLDNLEDVYVMGGLLK